MTERAAPSREAGFTLIELTLAAALTIALLGTMLSVVFSSAQTGSTVRDQHDLTQEATVVLNRLTREIREAKAISSVTNATGPNYSPTGDVAVTFDVDFNGDGVIDPYAPDPERLTYTFQRSRQRVLLQTANTATPVIAGGVQDLTLSFTARGADWTTLDPVAAGGNGNGLLDGFELAKLDAVQVHLVMSINGRTQTFDTGVNLRNLTRG